MSNINLLQMSSSVPTKDGDTKFSFLFDEIENVKFGYVSNLNKIETAAFLEASKIVVLFVERMGKVFAPLKHDMNGNIMKLTITYLENERNHKYIDEMILNEKQQGKDVATDALQWLRRGLHFMAKFFSLIIDDENKHDRLDPLIKIAYQEVLQRYHGWMGVQLFNIMCRFAPKRRELFKILAPENCSDEEILKNMTIFKSNLYTVIDYLIKLYKDHDLETNTVV